MGGMGRGVRPTWANARLRGDATQRADGDSCIILRRHQFCFMKKYIRAGGVWEREQAGKGCNKERRWLPLCVRVWGAGAQGAEAAAGTGRSSAPGTGHKLKRIAGSTRGRARMRSVLRCTAATQQSRRAGPAPDGRTRRWRRADRPASRRASFRVRIGQDGITGRPGKFTRAALTAMHRGTAVGEAGKALRLAGCAKPKPPCG